MPEVCFWLQLLPAKSVPCAITVASGNNELRVTLIPESNERVGVELHFVSEVQFAIKLLDCVLNFHVVG